MLKFDYLEVIADGENSFYTIKKKLGNRYFVSADIWQENRGCYLTKSLGVFSSFEDAKRCVEDYELKITKKERGEI